MKTVIYRTSMKQAHSFQDPPTLPQRPFTEDYPDGNQNLPNLQEGSPLQSDREGRSLTAPLGAGLRTSGTPDQGINHVEIEGIARGLTGRPPELTND